MLPSIEHSMYIEKLKAMFMYYNTKVAVPEGMLIKEVHDPVFGHLKVGDLCLIEEDSEDPQSWCGIISELRIVVTSTHSKVHLWANILIGDEDYVFHSRICSATFDHALLYTKAHAMSVKSIIILNELTQK